MQLFSPYNFVCQFSLWKRDREHLLLALKNVAEARKSQIDLAKQTDFDGRKYERLLAGIEKSELLTIADLLSGLGLKLSVTVKEEQAA